ncbi:NAD-dependent epimerase/dehydratase family protein [Pseudomonas sp.]|uniref:NAD-dependent epimerase/dehydratase family protein n=1 Tax=Pseudomonas sp. TaxID=306 RepID=UPI00258F3D01|nr:NAD-dependent epimerase/dehydratase family protein [Pseudomonas sp.]
MPKNILVTGVTGFVGSAVSARLATDARYAVVKSSRSPGAVLGGTQLRFDLDNPDPNLDLSDIDCIVHAAARVHVLAREDHDHAMKAFRTANVRGTAALAEAAAQCGVRRFIFVSSIKVNGEHTLPGAPFTADDMPAPVDPYAISKYEAERFLLGLAKRSKMEVVIIRPPLIYGPGVKANYYKMMEWLVKGIPLPLGAVENARSFVSLDNLIDLILLCIDHPSAHENVFMVSDGMDLSTPQLLQKLGVGLGARARLLTVPIPLLRLAMAVVGKREAFNKICSSLQVDISATTSRLGWLPPVSLEKNIEAVTNDFLQRSRSKPPVDQS